MLSSDAAILGFPLETVTGILADACVLLIVVICIAVGIRKGFVKTIKGTLASIVAVALAVVCVSPVTSLVVNSTQWNDTMATKISEQIDGVVPNAYAVVSYMDDDGDTSTPEVLMFRINGEVDVYDNIFVGTMFGSTGLEGMVQSFVEDCLVEDGSEVVFIDAISSGVVGIVFTAIAFIVLLILFKIAISLMLYFAKRLVTELHLAYFVDRLLGGIMGVVASLVVIILMFTLIQVMSGLSFMEPVNLAMQNSYICKFITENNFVYNAIAGAFDASSFLGGGE